MPLYEYACAACAHRFEIRQGIRDASLTTCPECGGAIRRVLFPVGIVFKGSGFYKTDSRSTPRDSVPAGERKAEGNGSDGEPKPGANGSNGETPAAKSKGDGAAAAAPAASAPSASTPAASTAK
ncbi:MAG TPA: FmdB family zinc ribbon protein [Chloroflexota bacterium]|nr:FmdB family zinc ribbon protein [Chloroflexota bacterium]